MRKRFIMGLAVLFVILGIAESVVYSVAVTSKPEKSDAVMILGCKVHGNEASKLLKARILKGKELYEQGYGEYIIVSGGKASGEKISEAEVMKNILLENGVPKDKILIEDKSTNTAENILFSKVIINEKNIRNVVIVSNKSHLTRIKMVCDKKDVKATYSGVFVVNDILNEIFNSIREIPAIIKYIFIE